MATPWSILHESSSSPRSSPISGVYKAALANFVAMKTQMMRKPYETLAERDDLIVEAEILASQLIAFPARGAPPSMTLHVTDRFIIIQLTGSPAWTYDATRRVQAAGWKKHRDIQIKDTVEIKPYFRRANYMGPPHPAETGAFYNYVGSTPSPDDRPVIVGEHGPDSMQYTWMNLGTEARSKGGVTAAAQEQQRPLAYMAQMSSHRRSVKNEAKRGRVPIAYTEQRAYQRGMQDAFDAAAAYMENAATSASVSNAVNPDGWRGGRRKTRKARRN